MRTSREEKARSHARIVRSASRLLRARGVEGTSVADVMSDAKLTHGGFYRHFDSKEALLSSGLAAAFDEIIGQIDARFAQAPPAEAGAAFKAHYLSRDHVRHPELGCPIAALAGEVRREGIPLRSGFADGVERVVVALARGHAGAPEERRAAALRELAMMAGAVVIARAAAGAVGEEMLAACRR